MPRLRRTWTESWAQLGGAVPKHLSQQRQCGPSRNVVRVLFATVFGDEQPSELRLEIRLRSPKTVFTELVIEQYDVDLIDRAVELAKPVLEATAELFAALKIAARARDLPGEEVDAHLLRQAHEWVAGGVVVDAEMIESLLDDLDNLPTPTRLRAELEASPDFVADLGRQLTELWESASAVPSQVEESELDVYLDFLDDESLDAKTPDAQSQERWEQVHTVDPAGWQSQTAVLGLSETAPPVQPPVCKGPADESLRAHEWHRRWLDESLERRVAATLKGSRAKRARLPALRDLMTNEVRRAVQPLGLAERDSRTVLTLGAVATRRVGLPEEGDKPERELRVLGAGRATARAAHRINMHFYLWRQDRLEGRPVATFPKVWTGILADPLTFYLAYLWLRLHNDEVHERRAFTAVTAYQALVEIGQTVTDRITTLPASTPKPVGRGQDDPDGVPEDLHRGRTVALYFEVDRIREGVDPDEFTAFFASVGADPEADQQRWQTWTAAAGSQLALADVLDWRDRIAPRAAVAVALLPGSVETAEPSPRTGPSL